MWKKEEILRIQYEIVTARVDLHVFQLKIDAKNPISEWFLLFVVVFVNNKEACYSLIIVKELQRSSWAGGHLLMPPWIYVAFTSVFIGTSSLFHPYLSWWPSSPTKKKRSFWKTPFKLENFVSIWNISSCKNHHNI